MTVAELMHSVSKAAVLASLAMTYTEHGEDPEGYSAMWDRLLVIQPTTTTTRCVLSQSTYGIDVSGIEDGSHFPMAIEFRPWAEWLSMPVVVNPELGDMSPVEQMCHILYELSWGGYTEKAQQDTFDMIVERAEEVKQMIEDGTIDDLAKFEDE